MPSNDYPVAGQASLIVAMDTSANKDPSSINASMLHMLLRVFEKPLTNLNTGNLPENALVRTSHMPLVQDQSGEGAFIIYWPTFLITWFRCHNVGTSGYSILD